MNTAKGKIKHWEFFSLSEVELKPKDMITGTLPILGKSLFTERLSTAYLPVHPYSLACTSAQSQLALIMGVNDGLD